MFVNVLRAQQTKTLASGVLWIELAALAAITALLVTLTNTMAELKADAPVTLAGQMNEMLQHAGTSTMGHVLAVVLAGAIMAHEYNWRSLHLWLSQGVSRTTLLWTKFVSLIVPVALFFVVTAAVTAGVAGTFLYVEHGSIGPVAGELGDLLRTAGLGAYGVLPFAALALLLAVSGRSMLVAVGGGLALTMMGEMLFVQIMGMIGGRALDLVAYLPGSLVPGVLGMDIEAYQPLEPGAAALAIAIYTVLFMGAATLIFQRQDLHD